MVKLLKALYTYYLNIYNKLNIATRNSPKPNNDYILFRWEFTIGYGDEDMEPNKIQINTRKIGEIWIQPTFVSTSRVPMDHSSLCAIKKCAELLIYKVPALFPSLLIPNYDEQYEILLGEGAECQLEKVSKINGYNTYFIKILNIKPKYEKL